MRVSSVRAEMADPYPDDGGNEELGRRTLGKAGWRLLPLLAVCYAVAFMDRANVSYAALQMNRDLHFNAAVYGFGAGVFFLSYAFCELPSNYLLLKFGARRWLARIMVTWGVIAAAMMFVRSPASFYALRFLLGMAEAGFFPGVIYYLSLWFPQAMRSRAIGRFYVAFPLANVLMGLVAGSLLSLNGRLGLRGWQWLFVAEAVPAVVLGVVLWRVLPDGPETAVWLEPAERLWLLRRLDEDRGEVGMAGRRPAAVMSVLREPRVWLVGLFFFCVLGASYAFSFSAPAMLVGVTGWTAGRVGMVLAVLSRGGAGGGGGGAGGGGGDGAGGALAGRSGGDAGGGVGVGPVGAAGAVGGGAVRGDGGGVPGGRAGGDGLGGGGRRDGGDGELLRDAGPGAEFHYDVSRGAEGGSGDRGDQYAGDRGRVCRAVLDGLGGDQDGRLPVRVESAGGSLGGGGGVDRTGGLEAGGEAGRGVGSAGCAAGRECGEAGAGEGVGIVLLNESRHLLADVAAEVEVLAGVAAGHEAADLHGVLGEIGDLEAADFAVPEGVGVDDGVELLAEGFDGDGVVDVEEGCAHDVGGVAGPVVEGVFDEVAEGDDDAAEVPDLDDDVGGGDLLDAAPLVLDDDDVVDADGLGEGDLETGEEVGRGGFGGGGEDK